MFNKKILACVIAVSLGTSCTAFADKKTHAKSFHFTPIAASAYDATWNPLAPWLLPAGYSQHVIADESDLNIYDGGRNDWHDMNTVNETGKHAGRYLYRTHEVRIGVEYPEGGAVSVVDLKTGLAKLVAQDPGWTALDGIEWTPWGTVLFAEEVTDGRLFEFVPDKNDMTTGTVYDRPAVGRMAHEGIQVAKNGTVYVIDEFRGQSTGYGGGIYKFIPDNYGDLSSGKLFVLKVTGEDGVGQGEWLGPIDAANARIAGTDAGGTSYQRPEDTQIIQHTLYVAVTEGLNYAGRVLAINLETLQVSNYVKPGINAPIEDKAAKITGFAQVDNLAVTADGRLVMIEDNVPSDIWITNTPNDKSGFASSIDLFASLTDPKAEGTGIYFGKDPNTLFVNVQHSAASDGDGTWAIRKTERAHKPEEEKENDNEHEHEHEHNSH